MARTLEWIAIVVAAIAVVISTILSGGTSDLARSQFATLAGLSLAFAAFAMLTDGRWRVVPSILWFIMALILAVGMIQIVPGLPGKTPLSNPGWARVLETTAHTFSADRQLTMQSLIVFLSTVALTYVFSLNASTPGRLTSLLLTCGFVVAIAISYQLAVNTWGSEHAIERSSLSSLHPFVKEGIGGSASHTWASMAAVLAPLLLTIGILSVRRESSWFMGLVCWAFALGMTLLAGAVDLDAGVVATVLSGVVVLPLASRTWRGSAVSFVVALVILSTFVIAYWLWTGRFPPLQERMVEASDSCRIAWAMLLDHFWLGTGIGTASEILPLYGQSAGVGLATLAECIVEFGAISASSIIVLLVFYFAGLVGTYHRLDETSRLVLAGSIGSLLSYGCLAAVTPQLAVPGALGLMALIVGVMMRSLVHGFEQDAEGIA